MLPLTQAVLMHDFHNLILISLSTQPPCEPFHFLIAAVPSTHIRLLAGMALFVKVFSWRAITREYHITAYVHAFCDSLGGSIKGLSGSLFVRLRHAIAHKFTSPLPPIDTTMFSLRCATRAFLGRRWQQVPILLANSVGAAGRQALGGKSTDRQAGRQAGRQTDR